MGPGCGHEPCSPRRSGPRSSWPGRTSSSGRRTSRSRTLGRGEKQRRGEPPAPPRLRSPFRVRTGHAWTVTALYFTLHEVRVIRLVSCEHGRHLIVVGGVDVLVNAIAGQLYLRERRRRRRGRKGFSAGISHSPHTHLHCQPGDGGEVGRGPGTGASEPPAAYL